MILAALLKPMHTAGGAIRVTVRTLRLVPELADAVLVLPHLSRQLHEVQLATSTLPEMLRTLERMRDDTSVLPGVRVELAGMSQSLAEVAHSTRSVPQLADIALPLTSAAQRVGRLADRLPTRHGTASS